MPLIVINFKQITHIAVVYYFLGFKHLIAGWVRVTWSFLIQHEIYIPCKKCNAFASIFSQYTFFYKLNSPSLVSFGGTYISITTSTKFSLLVTFIAWIDNIQFFYNTCNIPVVV